VQKTCANAWQSHAWQIYGMFLNKNTKKSKKDDPKLCGLLHHSGSPFEDRR
jgi:hypothetical protein